MTVGFLPHHLKEPNSLLRQELMVSSLPIACLINPLQATLISTNKSTTIPSQAFQERYLTVVSCRNKHQLTKPTKNGQGFSSSPALMEIMFQKSVIPLAASLAVVFWPNPAHAGFLSGFPGIESIPGPQLPQIDFLTRFNEKNQKMYAENDARFKESPLLKKLLERTKLNKEKNKQELIDKYCIRGAEWGVGDCSAEGMSPEEREKFISMLKKKAGVE